jgi:hypothetical protein
VALETLALRQQLHALKRAGNRSTLRWQDRLFWVMLTKSWRDWRTVLIIVKPGTVVRCANSVVAVGRSSHGRPARPSRYVGGHSRAHRPDGRGESAVGRPADSWGNCARWASRSRNGRFPGSCGDGAIRRHRRGALSWPIMWRRRSRWISSQCRPHRPSAVRARPADPPPAGGSSTSTSLSIQRRSGRRNKWSKSFLTTRHRDGC